MRLEPRSRRADRPLEGGLVHVRGLEGHRLRGRHDRLGGVRGRKARLLALVQVPPPARPPLLLGALPELPDDRRRRPERPRLHRADPRGRGRRGAERALVARLRLHVGHGQDRRARSRPVGFYYRTFIRPRALWPLYEKFLRSAAGLGKLDPHAGHSRRYDTEHRRARVLVVGGGEAGRAAALAAAKDGPGVVLVDEDARLARPRAPTASRCSRRRRRSAIWEGGLVPVDAGTVLYRFRAERIVVATGATEQPLVFPGNDLVGVMLPDGVRRLIRDFSIRPGERAVVLGSDDDTLAIADELEEVGIEVSKVLDLRDARPRELVAAGKERARAAVRARRRAVSAATSSSPPAGASLRTRFSRRRARGSSTTSRSASSSPRSCPRASRLSAA